MKSLWQWNSVDIGAWVVAAFCGLLCGDIAEVWASQEKPTSRPTSRPAIHAKESEQPPSSKASEQEKAAKKENVPGRVAEKDSRIEKSKHPVGAKHMSPKTDQRSLARDKKTASLKPKVSSVSSDSGRDETNIRRGIYDRPYLFRSGSMIAIGGYVDLLGSYFAQEGVSDGFSFEARRFNLFVFSSIARLIRLTAELEFEHGTSEIALETALVDIRLHSMLNIRGGILLVPLGRFNIAHDSPIYDVIDRPLVSTRIIPSTYSDLGAGFFGVFYFGYNHKLNYEIYVINGLTAGIVGDSEEGTRIARGKSLGIFEEDQNGVPSVAGRVSYTLPFGLEIGVSGYAGIYNKFQRDGEQIDDPRWLKILAVDVEFSRGPVTFRAEAAWAWIDIPETLNELFASFQWGVYADVSVTVWRGGFWMLRNASLALVARFDYIDLNVGTRKSTQQNIGDETLRVTAGISFRPTPQMSLRLSYQHNWLTDSLGNASRKAGIQLGLASYF